MTDEELLKITDSMHEKLGDNAGVIADDIGLLITGNSNSQKALVAKDEEIKRQLEEKKAMFEKMSKEIEELKAQLRAQGIEPIKHQGKKFKSQT